MTLSDPEFVLVPDGHGGLRMAAAGTADPAAWQAEPIALDPTAFEAAPSDLDSAPPVETRDMRQPLAIALGVCLLGVVLGVGLLHHPRRPAATALETAAPQGLTILAGAPHAAEPPLPLPLPLVTNPPPTDSGPANAIPAAAVTAPSAVVRRPVAVARLEPPPPEPVRMSFPAPAAPPPRLPVATDAEARGIPASANVAQPDENGCSGSPAERMVCSDSELGDFDREMHRDLRAAARAGAPLDELRAGQADFARRRDAAARRSPEAVAQVYDQRIVELERMIDEAPR